MRKSVLGSIAVTAVGLAVSTAWAAELGSLTVYSAAGEPLRAQLTVKDVDASQSPRVRLAPASLYNRVGKPLVIPVSDLTLKVESTNPYTLSIVSKTAVKANTFPLIVELSQGADRSAKLYNVTLKERAAAPRQEPVKEAVKAPAAQTAAPRIPSAIPSAQKAPEVAKAPMPAVAAIPSARTEEKSATPDVRPMQPIVRPAEKPAVRTAQAAPEPKFVPAMPKVEPQKSAAPATDDLYPDSVDTRKPFTVEPGMTMWSIAKLFKSDYPDATMDQLLVAFVRDNPRNFERGRVNGVRVGSTLRAPKASTVNRVTVDEAWALVRINPNADARKAPSSRDLKRAQDRMKKASPSLYKEVEARLAKERAAVRKLAAERKAAAEKKRQAELEAQKAKEAQEQKAAAAATAATAAPAAAAAQDNDPLAATIEATSKGEKPAQAQSEPAAQTQPAQTQTTENQPSQTQSEEAPAGDTVVKAEPQEQSSMKSWLIALIVALVAAIGGAAAWLLNRNRKQREADEAAMRTVNFMKASPTDDAQLKGAEQMVANRIQADAAAARGFDVKREAAPAAKTLEKTEPSFAPAQEVVQKPAVEPVQSAAQPASEPAQTAAAPSGFNVASAFVGDAAQLKSESSGQNNHDMAAGKLVNARNYIGVGGYDQAARVLHEVLLVGNEEQCRQARELLAQIESRKGES